MADLTQVVIRMLTAEESQALLGYIVTRLGEDGNWLHPDEIDTELSKIIEARTKE